jgi:arginine-tRNA-protein transferase
MVLYHDLTISNPVSCPYLENKTFTQAYFYAGEVDYNEAEILFSTGWRKFGYFFFRPVCVQCRNCIPVRIPVEKLSLSKSQNRLARKNTSTQVQFLPLEFDEEVFEVYKEHSVERFGKKVDRDEFIHNFCTISCPSLLSKYYINGTLAAAGFLDISSQGLSSVYFVFRTQFQHLGLGNYSVIREAEQARSMGLKYYYLGYYVVDNRIMEYKTRFLPYETYNWNTEQWESVGKNDNKA